jgi:hypothetical protein
LGPQIQVTIYKLEMYSHPSGWELLAGTSDLRRTNYLAKPHLSELRNTPKLPHTPKATEHPETTSHLELSGLVIDLLKQRIIPNSPPPPQKKIN